MKKYQVVIFILFISSINLFSQESGWEITDRIKNQKLALKDLVDVCVSPDSNYIYTAHSTRIQYLDYRSIIHKWDIKGGSYIGTIEVPNQNVINFSSDGKYLNLYTGNLFQDPNFQTTFYIYDIANTKIKNEFQFNRTNHMSLNWREVDYVSTYLIFDKFDYDDNSNELHLSLSLNGWSYQGGYYESTTFYLLGGSVILRAENDSLLFERQFSRDRTFCNITINDKNYISTFQAFDNGYSVPWNKRKIQSTSFLTAKGKDKSDTIMKADYECPFTGEFATASFWGDSTFFKYLVHNKDKNKLVATYSNKLLYFDVDFWNLKDSLISDSAFKLASFCNEGRYILNVVRDSLIIINVTDKFVDETIKLPFAPNKIKLLQNDANLMIFNENGNFAMVNLPKCFNLQQIIDPDTTVIPLDTIVKLIRNYDSDQIELNQEKIKELSNSQIQILDILGKTVLTINADMLKSNPIIDISNLKSGIYFIKYKDGVVKIIK